MRLLLDTHIFLWLGQGSNRITPEMLTVLTDGQNQLFLSTVTLWEMQIKHALGKLELPTSVQNFFFIQRHLSNLQIISVTEQHIWTLGTLPHHHRDPFDRMLIAQAMTDNFTLVSADTSFAQYPVALLGRSNSTYTSL